MTKKFENDSAEVEVELEDGDTFDDAVMYAKLQVERALGMELADGRRFQELAEILSTRTGQESFKAWCASQTVRRRVRAGKKLNRS